MPYYGSNGLPLSGGAMTGAITGTGATVTASAPVLDMTQTWNSAGVTFTGWKLNVTDTTSASASLLADLQVAASSKFSVRKDGLVASANGFTASAGSFRLGATGTIEWNGGDVTLQRDAANTLALRNGTSAQISRTYNTFTDASNGEWAELAWVSNVAYLRAQKNGTGTQRLMIPVTGTTTVASLPSAATAGASARAFVTDATAPTFGATVAGAGAVATPVYSDGTNWKVG